MDLASIKQSMDGFGLSMEHAQWLIAEVERLSAIRALSSPPPDTAHAGETCEWAYDPEDVSLWLSGCGYCFTGKRDAICPRCGKPISVKQ